MKTVTVMRSASTKITQEVADMIALRHGDEQRGNFEPIGRLSWLQTEHGLIYFPAVNGEGCGPDLAVISPLDWNTLLVLGPWSGLPPLRVNTTKACPKCRHACDVCDGSGKKLCELCGGAGWKPGPWLPCPGPGCTRDTGGFAGGGRIADGCATCHCTGQVPDQITCTMCEGCGKQTCSRCAGTGKYSTGRANGSVDWDVSPKCKACDGTTYVGSWKNQDVKKFTNATLEKHTVIGPIRQFAIRDPQTLRTRLFDVSPDAAGDYLVMLVPRSARQKIQKAYLVGGVVRERDARSGAA